MKSLLIGINAKYIHPAVALYQLKKNTTYETTILEFTIKENNLTILNKIKEELNNSLYSLISFSCYLWNIEKNLFIASIIKQEFPNIKIMFGGPEVGFDAKHFLEKYNFINYIIASDGEIAHHELLLYLDKKINISDVSNLRYLKNNIYIENKLLLPDLKKIHLATLDINDLENRVVYLESGRGCPYKCSYCTASLENKVRFFPLENVLDIIKELIRRRVKTVKFLDRTFNANMNYMIDILDYIDNNNICTSFQFEIVVEKFTNEAIEKVRSLKNKFLRFEIGIQSIHESVNNAVFRNQKMELLEEKLLLLRDTKKVDLHVDLIAGLPFETKEMFIESFNKVFNYQVKELQLGFLKFLRGTKLLDSVDEHGFIYDNNPPYEIISNNYMSKNDLEEIHMVEDALEKYYNSGKFKKTFNFLFENNIVNNFYQFFLNLYNNMDSSSLINLFISIDNFFKENYSNTYECLHFNLICDYLDISKTKPKIWWNISFTKEERNQLNGLILSKLNLNKEDLYRYSTIYYDKILNKIYIVIYKNYTSKSYLINNFIKE